MFNEEQPPSTGHIDASRQKSLSASLVSDLQRDLANYSANPDLNREVAAGILACFPSDRFDTEGLPPATVTI